MQFILCCMPLNFKDMKNTTVEQLIEILKKMNPKSVVCHLELEDDKPIHSSFEICREIVRRGLQCLGKCDVAISYKI